MKALWHIEPAGLDAVLIRFGEQIQLDLVPTITAASQCLQRALGQDLRGMVPSYTTLMLFYDLRKHDFASIQFLIDRELAELVIDNSVTGRLVEIPVWYDPAVGPDLQRVADYHQINIDEVIHRHTANSYQVFAIGFAPGFAYMGQVSQQLATPRLDRPRQRVSAGSVAIADQQTTVYPTETPGGWNILGRTPMSMFDRAHAELCPVKTGDRVRFKPISKQQFLEAGGVLA